MSPPHVKFKWPAVEAEVMKPTDLIRKIGAKLREGTKAGLKRPIIAGVALGLTAIQPVAAQVDGGAAIGEALCSAGLDVILQAGLFIAVLSLIIMSFGDVFKALKGQGGDARRRSASGGHMGSAGKKFFGAVILAALPSILTSMGFSMVSCFGNIAINIFGG
jgi:hypothetical protein